MPVHCLVADVAEDAVAMALRAGKEPVVIDVDALDDVRSPPSPPAQEDMLAVDAALAAALQEEGTCCNILW